LPGGSHGVAAWWLRRDPHGVAFTRGLRAAVAGPAVFAFGLEVLDNPAFAGTAAFGAIAAVIFSDYGGDRWRRTVAYAWLAVVGALLLAWGTAVSTTEWAAIVSTFVVAAAVRFAGNLGPRANASVSSLILGFVLGVLVPGPTTLIPDRVAGWLVGVAAAALVSVVIRPGRTSDHLDHTVTAAARDLAVGVRAVVDPMADRAAARDRVESARASLRGVLTMPLRAGGPGLHSVARRAMVDRLVRLAAILSRSLDEPAVALTPEVRDYGEAVARLLGTGAAVLARSCDPHALVAEFAGFHRVRDAVFGRLVALVDSHAGPDTVLDQLGGAFPVRAGGLHAEAFARAAAALTGARDVAAAERAGSDRAPDGSSRASLVRTRRFVEEHVQSASVWLRDALRAGIALALAVTVADAFVKEHAFWVALGTLSVLRSSALATTRSSVEAAAGTMLGFVAASLVFAVVGLDQGSLWVVLVLAVFLIGALPAIGGVVWGQAAFSVAVIVLFNILEPSGWRTGLVRVENVALGALVAGVVSLIFWPHRLEPLVRRLTREFGAATGAFLVGSVRARSVSAAASAADHDRDRDAAVLAEARARAALTEMSNQYRQAPATVAAWVGRVGVAAHGRSIADAISHTHGFLPGGASPTGLDPVLDDRATVLAGDLAVAEEPPPEPRRAVMAEQFRAAARPVLLDSRESPEAVVSALCVCDWLVTLAGMVDDRP
jgi:uncharacterized membrane protein YgaE (UPF0421/DUF939 family)